MEVVGRGKNTQRGTKRKVFNYIIEIFYCRTLGETEFIDNNQLWHRMLSDDKLASEGYHELMINFNIQYIKNSSECSISNDSTISKSYLGYITKTPLLIAVVKWINLVTGHQV